MLVALTEFGSQLLQFRLTGGKFALRLFFMWTLLILCLLFSARGCGQRGGSLAGLSLRAGVIST
jgi:hypothetical protein